MQQLLMLFNDTKSLGIPLRHKYIRTKRARTTHHARTGLIVAGLVLLVGIAGFLWHQRLLPGQSASGGTVLLGDKSAPVNKAYGIAAGSSLTSLDSQQLNQALDGMATLGVQWIRLDFDWSLIQPDSSQSFNWTTYDNIVAAIQQRHMYILGILDYTPSWARPASCQDSAQCPPADPSQFATFASQVSQHYASKDLHYWEIWNEPNNPGFWQPKSSPADYVSLLKQTYTALKQQDSKAYVLTAGLSPQSTNGTAYAPVDFLKAVYANGGKGYFDAVADHPYTFPLSPTDSADHAWNQMAATTNSLRNVMVTNGDTNKKIWITEFGAPTGGPGPVATLANPNLKAQPYVVDQGLQNKIMQDALSLYSSYNWVGPFFWYSYQDAGTTQDTNENFFGLITHDGTPKQAYYSYKNWIDTHKAN